MGVLCQNVGPMNMDGLISVHEVDYDYDYDYDSVQNRQPMKSNSQQHIGALGLS